MPNKGAAPYGGKAILRYTDDTKVSDQDVGNVEATKVLVNKQAKVEKKQLANGKECTDCVHGDVNSSSKSLESATFAAAICSLMIISMY